jgi:hypothetical protein
MDPIQRVLQYWHAQSKRPLGPVEATVVNAVLTLEQVFSPDRFDEETITAALLGSLAGGLPWVAPAVGSRAPEGSDIAWGHFAKKGSSEKHVVAESAVGADFALTIRIAPDCVRLGLFQAKRPKNRATRKILIFKDTPDQTQQKAQFLALRKTAATISKSVLGRPISLSDLHWVHYLGYLRVRPVVVPLPTLDAHANAAATNNAPTRVDVTFEVPDDARSLIHLLSAAVATPPGMDCHGWLEMTPAQANVLLPNLTPLMPVFAADEREGGGMPLDIVDTVAVTVPSTPEPKPTADPAPTSGAAPPRYRPRM